MRAFRIGSWLGIWYAFTVCLGVLMAPTQTMAQQRRAVDLELVLAIDTSTSVDAQEFDRQWRGLARAFTDIGGAIR